MAWEDLSKDEKVSELIDALVYTAVDAVEQAKAIRYATAQARTPDTIDKMRIDVEYWFPLVRELREAGRIPSADEIRQKAESMVNLPADEMRKALAEFGREVKAR